MLTFQSLDSSRGETPKLNGGVVFFEKRPLLSEFSPHFTFSGSTAPQNSKTQGCRVLLYSMIKIHYLEGKIFIRKETLAIVYCMSVFGLR